MELIVAMIGGWDYLVLSCGGSSILDVAEVHHLPLCGSKGQRFLSVFILLLVLTVKLLAQYSVVPFVTVVDGFLLTIVVTKSPILDVTQLPDQ